MIQNFHSTVVRTLRSWFGEHAFRRIFKNAGLMLSGRAVTGLLSLGTLSICARGLGIEQFGILALVQTYGQVIATMATFQSCQAMIRYGAISLEQRDRKGFQGLLKFLTMLDAGGGVAGVVLGYIVAPIVGPHLGWSDEVVGYVQAYSLLVFFTVVATPTGLLRLLDRFDLLAIQTTITPLFRLIGVAVAWLLSAPLWAYLMAWFIAQFAGSVSLTYLAWREAYRRGHLTGLDFGLRGLTAPHTGIWQFTIMSNLYMSFQILANHANIFLVGYFGGPAAAGIFKIGREASTVLSKPAELLNNSIMPEFARLGSRRDWQDFLRLILRSSAVAAGVGGFMLLLTIAGGSQFLGLAFGQDFVPAYLPLTLLVAAAAVYVVGFPMDAALFAMGKASIPLRVSTGVILLVQLPLLVLLARLYGPTGAGLASLAASTATLILMTTFTLAQLRQRTSLQGSHVFRRKFIWPSFRAAKRGPRNL
jgi:O-antigen/teichoic acid export membrane protein